MLSTPSRTSRGPVRRPDFGISSPARDLFRGRVAGQPRDTWQQHMLGAAASRTRRFSMAQPTIDPTFYRTATEAPAAPVEHLAHVVAFDRAAQKNDAMT